MDTKLHGFIDYVMVICLVLSGFAFEFPERLESMPFILAAAHVILTIFTNYPGGIFKVIPFIIHGIIEFIVGAGLIIFAFSYFTKDKVLESYYPTDQTAYNFCLFFGCAILLTWLLTKYKSRY